MKVELTDAEEKTLIDEAWSRFALMPSSNPSDYVHALRPAFESIVAARVAPLAERLERLTELMVGLEDGGEPDTAWIAQVRALLPDPAPGNDDGEGDER